MDNRFTKKRIANMLAYDWIKMIALIVAIVFIWVLAYTIGAPSTTKGQSFGIFYYYGGGTFKYTIPPKDYGLELKKAGAFSYDVLDFNMREITDDYTSELLMTSSIVQEGDVMITVDHPKQIEKFKSEFRNFVDGYADQLYDYDTLIADAKSYCLKNDLVYKAENGEYLVNEKNVKDLFAVRMQKDPRFKDKTSARYAEGVQGEIKRVKDIWNNALMLEECLASHPELRYDYARYTQAIAANPDEYNTEEFLNQESKTYAINLGKLSGGKIPVTDDFYYPVYGDEEDENKITGLSADGIVVCVYDYEYYQPHLQFETLSFINGVIARYSNFLNTELEGLIK